MFHSLKFQVSKSRVLRLLKKTYVVKKPYTPSSIVDKQKIGPIFKFVFDSYLEDNQKEGSKIVEEINNLFGEKVRHTLSYFFALSPVIQ